MSQDGPLRVASRWRQQAPRARSVQLQTSSHPTEPEFFTVLIGNKVVGGNGESVLMEAENMGQKYYVGSDRSIVRPKKSSVPTFVKKAPPDPTELKSFEREARFGQESAGVSGFEPQIYGFVSNESGVYVFQELLEGENVRVATESCLKTMTNEEKLFAFGCFLMTESLRGQGTVPLVDPDVKPDNRMIGPDLIGYTVDRGACVNPHTPLLRKENGVYVLQVAITEGYIPPELAGFYTLARDGAFERRTKGLDWALSYVPDYNRINTWQYGIVFYMMLFHEHPFLTGGRADEDFLRAWEEGTEAQRRDHIYSLMAGLPAFFGNETEDMKDLIADIVVQCLHPIPSKRLPLPFLWYRFQQYFPDIATRVENVHREAVRLKRLSFGYKAKGRPYPGGACFSEPPSDSDCKDDPVDMALDDSQPDFSVGVWRPWM